MEKSLIEKFSHLIPNVDFAMILIKNLTSNQNYQRELCLPAIERTAAHFDLFQVNPVKISRRDGHCFVINGQHTIEVIALLANSREVPVWCMIYDGLSYKREADIFANQQKYEKRLAPYEIFNGRVEAGNDEQIVIQSVVESYKLRIYKSSAPNTLTCVSCLERIYENYGTDVLKRTLGLVVATWQGEQQSLSANIISGVAKCVDTYGDEIKDDAFIERVGKLSARDIARTAREHRNGSLGFAEEILVAYNKRTSFGLQRPLLYEKQKTVSPNAADEPALSAVS
jgi:hypothetical protein